MNTIKVSFHIKPEIVECPLKLSVKNSIQLQRTPSRVPEQTLMDVCNYAMRIYLFGSRLLAN